MDARFHIIVNMKVAQGMIEFGRFSLGDDATTAYAIFGNLKGHKNVAKTAILRLDLIETTDAIDTLLENIGCTLDEYSHNCRHITKEVFKHFNLED
jgi:hypothetical protein